MAVAAIPAVLNMIPLAALAGMLVFIGFRLAHPKEFKHALHVGKEEFAFMLATTLVVVTVDLLWGVIFGFAVAVLVNLLRGGVKGFLKADTQVQAAADGVTLKLRGAMGFNNFVGVRGVLDSLPKGQQLVIDYSGVSYMDHTVRERLHDFKGEYEGAGGRLSVHGEAGLKPSSHHALCAVSRVMA